jgi:hypothetical protein
MLYQGEIMKIRRDDSLDGYSAIAVLIVLWNLQALVLLLLTAGCSSVMARY